MLCVMLANNARILSFKLTTRTKLPLTFRYVRWQENNKQQQFQVIDTVNTYFMTDGKLQEAQTTKLKLTTLTYSLRAHESHL